MGRSEISSRLQMKPTSAKLPGYVSAHVRTRKSFGLMPIWKLSVTRSQ